MIAETDRQVTGAASTRRATAGDQYTATRDTGAVTELAAILGV
jgi:hypothetical protein